MEPYEYTSEDLFNLFCGIWKGMNQFVPHPCDKIEVMHMIHDEMSKLSSHTDEKLTKLICDNNETT